MFDAFAVLNPKGLIALSERALMFHAIEFMLIVALPVYFLLFFFAYTYRKGNKKAKYLPNWEHGRLEELVWWVIPLEIILVLGALTWGSTHALDPRKSLGDNPLVVQAVALEWKWLFIYPEQQVATVNYLVMPVGRPVRFMVTADAPMNSFWIPQLGGQIYAMTGMTTTLNLRADEPGAYKGVSANYSGEGFAKMQFTAAAVPEGDFDTWVAGLQAATSTLGADEYASLKTPSTMGPAYFAHADPGLFGSITGAFMGARAGGHMH